MGSPVTIEPRLVIWLGPSTTPIPPDRWKDYERRAVALLFEWKDREPSLIESLCAQSGAGRLRITGHFFSIGAMGGEKVATVNIPASAVFTFDWMRADWPPPRSACDLLTRVLPEIMRRRWVRVARIR